MGCLVFVAIGHEKWSQSVASPSKSTSHSIPNAQFLEISGKTTKVSKGDAGPHFWKLIRCLK